MGEQTKAPKILRNMNCVLDVIYVYIHTQRHAHYIL